VLDNGTDVPKNTLSIVEQKLGDMSHFVPKDNFRVVSIAKNLRDR